jgi:hypothetical protein
MEWAGKRSTLNGKSILQRLSNDGPWKKRLGMWLKGRRKRDNELLSHKNGRERSVGNGIQWAS